jgi:hypothetical protein
MKTWTQHNLIFNSRKDNSGSPGSVISQFSPTGTLQNVNGIGGATMDGYSFPFQRRARSASPPKDPDINEKIAATLSPRHNRENNTSAIDDLFDDQVMGLQDPLRSQNSIHSRIGSGSFKSRKPIIANTKLFFIGGSTGTYSNKGSMIDDRNTISNDKMKVLSKAINHYLTGEYGKISQDDNQDNKLTENDQMSSIRTPVDLCTHDLRDHDISDGNEHDLTDENLATKKCEVDDWLWDEEKSNDISLEAKHEDGFDPFTQIKTEEYKSQRSLYKNKRNVKSKTNTEITNESIMQIIQNSQKASDKPSANNHKYTSLTNPDPEPEEIEKNIIVDDADLELVDCLEGEEWMFKTFNIKKKLEAQRAEMEANKANEVIIENQKPPIPEPKVNSTTVQKQSEPVSEPTNEEEENPRRRRKKNSKHRRTESKTFDKDFLQSLADNCPG